MQLVTHHVRMPVKRLTAVDAYVNVEKRVGFSEVVSPSNPPLSFWCGSVKTCRSNSVQSGLRVLRGSLFILQLLFTLLDKSS